MGVDTKGILFGKVSPIEIKAVVEQAYGAADVRIEGRSIGAGDIDTHRLHFTDLSEDRERMLWVFEGIGDYEDLVKGDKTVLSLGCWGDSKKIIRTVVEHFGGFFMGNDCSDDWESVPAKKGAAVQLSVEDRLRQELYGILGPGGFQPVAGIIGDDEKLERLRAAIQEYQDAKAAPAPGM